MKENANENYKNRWKILLAIVSMTFMCCLDGSIVNVALPVMAKKLSVTMASIEWVVTSYLVIISATILIFGRLGDIKGKIKVFKFGIIVFTLGSLMCGISSSIIFLIIARVIQAIGAAATMATNQGIITHIFPSNERGRALGISGSFVALGSMVGPALGGFILTALKWEYIFLINIPIGVCVFILAMKIFPKATNTINEKLDLKGAILFVIAIVLLFASLTRGQVIGYDHIIIILGFLISIICFITFVIVEKIEEHPLLQLYIFKNKLFSISIFCGFISFVAMFCSNIIQPFYLQDVQKLSPASAGFFMMIYPIILTVVAPASGHLSDKIGSEILTFFGLVFTSLGLLLMSSLGQHTPLWINGIYVAIMSIGNGLFQSPNNSLVMSAAPKDKLGIAGSVNALVRNLGMVVGVSLSTTILYSMMSYKIGHHIVSYVSGREDVFIYGMKYVYIVASLICLLGAILTALRLYKRRKNVKEVNIP